MQDAGAIITIELLADNFDGVFVGWESAMRNWRANIERCTSRGEWS